MNTKQTRARTQYIVDYENKVVTTYAEIHKKFMKMPNKIRQKYCESTYTYIYIEQKNGKLLVVKPNGNIASDRLFTPATYAKELGIKCVDSKISLAHFDAIVGDGFNLWNYPLDEYEHIVENGYKVVLVRFKDDGYRWVQWEL